MRRPSLGVCAVAGLLALSVGCQSLDLDLKLFDKGAPVGDRVVTGSLEAVAQSTQANLTKLGLAAEITKQGEAYYVTSRTSTGARFTLVLTREQTAQGEQTRVR